jgi:hypothetical protein
MKKLYEVTVYSKCRTVVAAKNEEDAYELSKELLASEWDIEIQDFDVEETYEDESRDDI